MNIVGISGTGAMISTAMGLLAEARKAEARLPKEERERRKELRLKESEERIRKAQIIRNICPSCEGKLVRGQKEKRNGYKRDWKCKSCKETHSI